MKSILVKIKDRVSQNVEVRLGQRLPSSLGTKCYDA